MQMIEIPGATRRFGAPKDWDEATQGPCVTLAIRDEVHNGVNFMLSAHQLDAEDIARAQAGAPLILGISGNIHPVIFTYVDEAPEGGNVTNAFDLIRQWAEARNLITGATPQAQMLKMTEEVGELAHAIARGDKTLAADAIGDCVVVLTILSAQLGLDIRDCINGAYDTIKDRKGRMVDGIFIKEEAPHAPSALSRSDGEGDRQRSAAVEGGNSDDDDPEPCCLCGGNGEIAVHETYVPCRGCNGTGYAR